MFESVIKRINELQENFFSNVAEEKIATEKKSSIFGDNYGAEKNKNNPGSISGILQNNSEKDKKDKEIQKQINEAKQKKSENEQNIRTSEQTISKTDNSIKTTKSEIVSLNGQLSSLHEPQQSEFMKTTTNEDGEEIQVPDTAAYEAAHNAYLQQKEALEQQIAQKEQELQQLEEDLNTAKNELTTLKQEQASIDSEISSLETEQQQEPMEETSDEQEDYKIKAKEENIQKEELNNIQNSANKTLFKIEQEIANSNIQLNGLGNIVSSNLDNIVSSVGTITDKLINNITKEEKDTDNLKETDSDTESETTKIIPDTTEIINSFFGEKTPESTEKHNNNYFSELYNNIFSNTDSNFTQWGDSIAQTLSEGIDSISGILSPFSFLNKPIDNINKTFGEIGEQVLSSLEDNIKTCMNNCLNEIQEIFTELTKEVEIDENGQMDINELEEIIEKKKKECSDEEKDLLDQLLMIFRSIDKDGDGKINADVAEQSLDSITEDAETVEDVIKNIENLDEIVVKATTEEEANEIVTKIHNGKDIDNASRLVRSGVSVRNVIKIMQDYKPNINQIIQLAESGVSFDRIEELMKHYVSAEDMANAIKLIELGKSDTEIIELLNNPNCRKGMEHVIQLLKNGISTSEITKIFNNPNALMNLNEVVELVSIGKKSEEINDLLNDSNSIGNLETVIKFAKMNINAKNIIGMLNDNNVKNVLTGSDNFYLLANNSKSKDKEVQTDKNDSKQYDLFKSIVDNMEYNNVQEKDIFKILSKDNPLNSPIFDNSNIYTADNLSIIETELVKKKRIK